MIKNSLHILFICSRNKWRSKTAESIFKKTKNLIVMSAGTENSARIKVNQKMIDIADIIFVMEKKHKERINNKFSNVTSKKVITLDIPDEYKYMDTELIEILNSSVNYYLNNNLFV